MLLSIRGDRRELVLSFRVPSSGILAYNARLASNSISLREPSLANGGPNARA